MFQVNDEGILLGFHEGKFSIPHELAGQLIGKSIYSLFTAKRLLPKRMLDQAMAYVKQTLETGKAQIFEQHIPFNGDQRDFEVRMVACSNNNVLGIVRDITRRKRLENEIIEISGRNKDASVRTCTIVCVSTSRASVSWGRSWRRKSPSSGL